MPDGGDLLPDVAVPAPGKQARTRRLSSGQQHCWSCGRGVLTRADASYACPHCDVREDPLGDPLLRARSRARELEAHRQKYGIDGWLDHGDPDQHRPAPALAARPD